MLEKVFKLVKAVPSGQYTEEFLKFYACYTKAAISNVQRRRPGAAKTMKAIAAENVRRAKEGKSAEEIDPELQEAKFSLYDLDVLWKKMLTRQNNTAMQYLIQVLARSEEEALRCFHEAVNGVTESREETLQCFHFLEELYAETTISKVVIKEMKAALGAEPLFEKVFLLFVKYQTHVAGIAKNDKVIKAVFDHVSADVKVRVGIPAREQARRLPERVPELPGVPDGGERGKTAVQEGAGRKPVEALGRGRHLPGRTRASLLLCHEVS